MTSQNDSNETPQAAAGSGEPPPGATPKGAGRAAARSLRAVVLASLAVSIVSLAVAVTAPLWSPHLYGNPGASRLLVLGIAQLRPALAGDEPFRAELTVVRGMVPRSPRLDGALAQLAGYADKGVPTLSQLRARFPRLANDILLAHLLGARDNAFDRAVISLAAAVRLHAVMHRLDDMRPFTQILWQAQQRLDVGDLSGAVAALEGLRGRQAAIAAAWIADARIRIAADEVLRMLDRVAQARIEHAGSASD
ncbi:MAG TPA: mitofilin family membrane protein [Stellaceae bacterium]|nr:mitofilin family membrane protein [Stellaceae bacterium]